VALLVPPTFSQALLTGGEAAPVTLLHDPTLTLGPQIVQDLVRLFTDSVLGAQIALTTTAEQAQAHGVAVDAAALQALGAQYAEWAANAERAQHHGDTPLVVVRSPAQPAAAPVSQLATIMGNIMSGMLVFFVFFTGANSAQSILREDEEGTLARLFTTPASRATILAGKFVAVFLTLAGQALVLVLLSALLFKINWGPPATLALVLAGLLVAAAGFGVCLVSFIKGLRQSGPIIGGVLAVTGMLGGLFTTGVTMPAAFERLNLLMPQGWAYDGLQLALSGASVSAALVPALVLAAYGAALFTIGALAFRRRYA
jgi:ABC-2 type transport system permease protein